MITTLHPKKRKFFFFLLPVLLFTLILSFGCTKQVDYFSYVSELRDNVLLCENGELVIKPKAKCITHKIETKNYRMEIARLAQKLGQRSMDAAFLVLDPRQEKDYWLGFDYTMRLADIRQVFPMHSWEEFWITKKLLEVAN
mgnify:CR=1 FL=1